MFESVKNSNSIDSSQATRMGLGLEILYESVIELTYEGMLTSRCVVVAANLLLSKLGLPAYYFKNLCKEDLKGILRVLALNLEKNNGSYALSSRTAHIQCDVDGGYRFFVSALPTRAYMERVISPMLRFSRWEYYHCAETDYCTYIVKSDKARPLAELSPGECPFAFVHHQGKMFVPEETSQRYLNFLKKHEASNGRHVDFSDCEATGETRVVCHLHVVEDGIPVIRELLKSQGLRLSRAYSEVYRTDLGGLASVCSLYIEGEINEKQANQIRSDLLSLCALAENHYAPLFAQGKLGFQEMLFAANASFFVHQFIYKEVETDRQIMDALQRLDLREAFSKRVSEANRNEYTRHEIERILHENPDLLIQVYSLFDQKFSPKHRQNQPEPTVSDLTALKKEIAVRFIDNITAQSVFEFLLRLVTDTVKTNFYKSSKRSFSFRFTGRVLDPLVFPDSVHGIFFVVGNYSLGTHMRAADISRGGLRILRVTPGSYENNLDEANLLNYALGPKAQRLKHKDIAESGAKGVIVPTPDNANDVKNAVADYCEGILDLMLPAPEVIDYLGEREMIFFGPDEGTAPVMDAVAEFAKRRGYRHWRTLTTGKSIGIPHDTYGLTKDGRIFGISDSEENSSVLMIEKQADQSFFDGGEIYQELGDNIETSGMTTTGIMAVYRTLLEMRGAHEEDLNLMMTGGPDGDLGANQIQTYRGKICLLIDGGGILFDPEGLDRKELLTLAFNRHAKPRLNSLAFDSRTLGPAGFMVPRHAKNITLPDGRIISDGALFHKQFLYDPENRFFIEQANIRAFIPCGGLKDTINYSNVALFSGLFRELEIIVEGANVFFDDSAREYIATHTRILQIRDSTANKGGVTSSSLAEVLSAFLLKDEFEKHLVENQTNKICLIRELLQIIKQNARQETEMLMQLYRIDSKMPLYRLSVETSEKLLELQDKILENLDILLAAPELRRKLIESYVPPILVQILGMETIQATLDEPELQSYRDAIISKKLASLFLYRYATEWDKIITLSQRDFQAFVKKGKTLFP